MTRGSNLACRHACTTACTCMTLPHTHTQEEKALKELQGKAAQKGTFGGKGLKKS